MSAPAYDPDARRETPLAKVLKERIGRTGPIRIADYMAACLGHPEHGYYRTRVAIGRDGDFITAPEIAQVFGELVGLWCVIVWQQLGQPAPFHLIELGPGRGTMMRDMLRAARVVPEFLRAAEVLLVEQNEALIDIQRATLRDAGAAKINWRARLVERGQTLVSHSTAPPSIVIANEFVDTFSIDQYVRDATGWHLRGVGVDVEGRLQFCTMSEADADALRRLPAGGPLPPGGIVEMMAGATATLAADLAASGCQAALLIDYGYERSQPGDTLQAVRAHQFEHVLSSPGEADLTAHVDFESLGRVFARRGFAIDGPTTQAEFLGQLGVIERASRLMSANPALAGTIEAGVARLIAPNGMGTRFKVMAVGAKGVPPLPGF